MTFEYQLPRELESFARVHHPGTTPPYLEFLIQESTLIRHYQLPALQDLYSGEPIPRERREIWHYSLSDRGYTLFSLQEEPNMIAVLEYWNARMEFRKTLCPDD